MLTLVSWGLAIVLSTAISLAGYSKLTEQPVMVKAREHFGLPARTYRLIGVAELSAAVGVLVGLTEQLMWVGLATALGVIVLMLGAISFHLRFGDQLVEMVPAVALTLLSLLYFAARALA